MQALSRVPLSEQAADALFSEIAGGRWQVGDQLPGEMALAAELGVGRSTIRESIRLLVARGLLATHQGIGVFLTATTAKDPFDRRTQVAAIADVVQVRVAIETRGAALAAQHHDPDDAAAITKALRERNALRHDLPSGLAATDIALHHRIVTAAHNTLLLSLFDDMHQRLVASMTDLLTLMPVDHDDADEHTAIVDAILDREPQTAEDLTRRHLLGLAEALMAIGAGSTPAPTRGH